MAFIRKLFVASIAAGALVATSSHAGGWDPIGDITHPDRIVRNVANTVNTAAGQGGPIVQFIAAPITAPLNAFNGCVHDLRTCPQQVINSTPQTVLVNVCLQDLSKCPENVLKGSVATAVWPVIWQYKQGLLNQAQGRWQALPEDFISEFGGDYPEIDLHQIRFATGINTVHGQAITFSNLIFIPWNISLDTRSGRQLLLHELEHSVQYRLKGGEAPFLSEYIMHAAGQIVGCGCVNVHDSIGIERSAISKAAHEIGNDGWQFVIQNSCREAINVAVHYLDESGTWQTHTWEFDAGERAALAVGDVRVQTRNTIYYFAATSVDGTISWHSNDDNLAFDLGGQRVDFYQRNKSGDSENFSESFTCGDS